MTDMSVTAAEIAEFYQVSIDAVLLAAKISLKHTFTENSLFTLTTAETIRSFLNGNGFDIRQSYQDIKGALSDADMFRRIAEDLEWVRQKQIANQIVQKTEKKETAISIRDMAKYMSLKETEFIEFLLKNRYLYRDKKGELKPYAEKMRYFTMRSWSNDDNGGLHVYVNQTGKTYFYDMLCNKGQRAYQELVRSCFPEE